MTKEKDIMQNFTVVAYREVFDEYLKLKEKMEWTHDVALKELVRSYREKEATNVHHNNRNQ